MADNRTARHDCCVFCAVVFGFVFSLAGKGPVRKVYEPVPARIAISPVYGRCNIVLHKKNSPYGACDNSN